MRSCTLWLQIRQFPVRKHASKEAGLAQEIREILFEHLLLYIISVAYGHWASTTSATALGVHSPSAIIAGAVSYFPKKRFMLALEHSLQFGVIPLCHEHPFVLRLLLLQIKLKTLFGNILKRPSIWNKLRFSKCSRSFKWYSVQILWQWLAKFGWEGELAVTETGCLHENMWTTHLFVILLKIS